MDITLEQAEEIMEEIGCAFKEVRIYENYSGRGMFGKETIGFSVDGNINEFIFELGKQTERLKIDLDGCEIRVDQLGLDHIVY